jgi:hypothetical protein
MGHSWGFLASLLKLGIWFMPNSFDSGVFMGVSF